MRIAVGTRKGVWCGDDSSGEWQFTGPFLGEAEIASVTWIGSGDEHPVLLVGALNYFWGATLRRSHDAGITWSEVPGIAFDSSDGASLERVWHLHPDPHRLDVVWAGCEPTSLWRSDDGGFTFTLNQSLWHHEHRPDWQPGAGGAAVHTVVPRPDGSIYLAMSTGGVYRSADEGKSWESANSGITVDFAPDPYPDHGQCVHRLAMDAADSDLLFVQNHGGVFRSRDAGNTWQSIAHELPADFGFVMVTHPTTADTAWVMPVDAALGRVPVNGGFGLYRTVDAGESWRPCEGFDRSWSTVLRDAAHVAARPDGTACVALGTRDGCVYVSTDDGFTFTEVIRHLPDVLSVRVTQ